jgi:hypothetical protein
VSRCRPPSRTKRPRAPEAARTPTEGAHRDQRTALRKPLGQDLERPPGRVNADARAPTPPSAARSRQSSSRSHRSCAGRSGVASEPGQAIAWTLRASTIVMQTVSSTACAPRLEPREGSARFRILTGWAEAVAEALAHDPDRTAAVMADARSDAPWRAAMRLAPPTGRLLDAIDSLRRLVLANGAATHDAMLAAAGQQPQDENPLDRMVRRALLDARGTTDATTRATCRSSVIRDGLVRDAEIGPKVRLSGPIPAEMGRKLGEYAGLRPSLHRHEIPQTIQSQCWRAWIAPRRSPVRVRLAPLEEHLQLRRFCRLGGVCVYCGSLRFGGFGPISAGFASLQPEFRPGVGTRKCPRLRPLRGRFRASGSLSSRPSRRWSNARPMSSRSRRLRTRHRSQASPLSRMADLGHDVCETTWSRPSRI